MTVFWSKAYKNGGEARTIILERQTVFTNLSGESIPDLGSMGHFQNGQTLGGPKCFSPCDSKNLSKDGTNN